MDRLELELAEAVGLLRRKEEEALRLLELRAQAVRHRWRSVARMEAMAARLREQAAGLESLRLAELARTLRQQFKGRSPLPAGAEKGLEAQPDSVSRAQLEQCLDRIEVLEGSLRLVSLCARVFEPGWPGPRGEAGQYSRVLPAAVQIGAGR